MIGKIQVAVLFILICLIGMGTGGCVERRLTIVTEPPGALVYLNDEEIGPSPVTVPFEWYGDYNLQCRIEGYEPLKTHRDLRAPWYDYFPFDFFAHNLYPGRIEDHTTWSFTLTPRQPMDRETLIENALAMQELLDDPNSLAR